MKPYIVIICMCFIKIDKRKENNIHTVGQLKCYKYATIN